MLKVNPPTLQASDLGRLRGPQTYPFIVLARLWRFPSGGWEAVRYWVGLRFLAVLPYAGMAELADAADSKSAGLRPLGVQLPLPAPT